MLVVTALGGPALIRRGEFLTADSQRVHIRRTAAALATLAAEHSLVIAHGNGPQVGMLALQGAAYAKVEAYAPEARGARTEAMIGYILEQEMASLLPPDRPVATVLAMAEVDGRDPAFKHPTTFIGPVYLREEAERMATSKGWAFKPDGDKWRRVVASPDPKRIFELRAIKSLLAHDTVVIVEGGGGIPAMYEKGQRQLTGAECVVDTDLACEVLARELGADVFVLLTEADALYADDDRSGRNPIRRASPEALAARFFGTRTMTAKVSAACRFAATTGRRAAIGAVADLPMILAGKAGTTVSIVEPGITYAAAVPNTATA
jgi:carbamate kinase